MTWIALYTTPEAKRICPGLWHGSIQSVAEAAHMSADLVVNALDVLLEREMVELDRENRVLRLTMLPDAGEGPANGNVIRGWWNRYRTVPQCAIRDAHVPLLRWIVDESGKETKKGKPSLDHEEAWSETFVRIPQLPNRRRGVRRLADNHTGTAVQPGLFDARSRASLNGGETVPEHGVEPFLDASESASGSGVPDQENQVSETVSKPFRSGSGSGSLISSSGEGGSGGGSGTGMPPRLALVPAFSPEQLLAELAKGIGPSIVTARPIVRETLRASICATIRDLDDQGITLVEVAAAGRYVADLARERPWRRWPNCNVDELLGLWAAQPGEIAQAVLACAEHERSARERSAMLREVMQGIP